MKRWAYDLMYRSWAPWDAVGVREDLRTLLESGRVSPESHPRAVDLGCGTGANAVYLAEHGFAVVGVDFSPVALAKARTRAERAGVDCRFVGGDLTTDLAELDGPFDLVLDFGTLDDLAPAGRRAMADNIRRLTIPGSLFIFWCFYADPVTLPRFSVTGPSRAVPVIRPGEEQELFGDAFAIEELSRGDRTACFLLTRRDEIPGR
jgi:SAM-dependent methyltransferase